MAREPGGTGAAAGGEKPIVIRKYANRRLYNTATGAFVTLEDLRRFVVEGQPFVVIDVKSDSDITSSVLAQIIADQEARGERVLPDALLRQIIGFYDQGLSDSFGAYLQKSMESYQENWQQMEKLGEMSRQNIEAFQRSFASMFGAVPEPPKRAAPTTEAPAADAEPLARQVSELQAELRALREKLARATGGKADGKKTK